MVLCISFSAPSSFVGESGSGCRMKRCAGSGSFDGFSKILREVSGYVSSC